MLDKIFSPRVDARIVPRVVIILAPRIDNEIKGEQLSIFG
jgi:hypothetical protein